MTRFNITEFDTLGAIAGSEFVYVATASGSIRNYKLTLSALGAWIGGGGGSVSWGGIAGTLSNQTDLQAALDLKANLASPALTGTPTAPTAAPGTNSTQLATTAYADAIAALKANLASPTFTGVPAAPTAAVDTNTTQIATTAFVLGQAAAATPSAIGTAAVGTSTRYARADHVHNTPMTTSQDIIVGGASGVATRLAVGANGTFLGVTAGTVGWTTPAGSGDFVGPASSVSGNIVSFNGTTGKLGQDSGVLASSVVVGPASVVTGRVASYNGTTGKLIADGGILVADVVTGPASATTARIATFNGTSGKIIQDGGSTIAQLAPLASPTFTGTPAAPTAAVDTNTTQLATTAFVVAQAASATPANNGTAAVGTSLRYARGDHVHNSDSTKANLASPTFTGDPLAPTPATGDDDTSIATTAFVQASVTAIAQNSQSAAYTLVLSDKGKHIFHPSADTTARTWTIPANASVAFAVGTVITFVNQNAAGVITIAITTDTMRLAGAGTTGSRTLAANGIATAIKVTSTEWLINGTGLT